MPWGWAPRHEARAQSHAEPSSTKPWKEHEAQVLKRLLAKGKGRFDTSNLNGAGKYLSLQEQKYKPECKTRRRRIWRTAFAPG